MPCVNLPPPGPGFLARVVPSTVKFGGTAWVQMRIPGTGYRLGPPSKGVRSIAGTATVSYGSGAAATPFGVSDRTAVPLRTRGGGALMTPGRYVVHVSLKGPTGKRVYQLPFVVR